MPAKVKKRAQRKQQLRDSEYYLSKRELKNLIGAAPNFRDRTLIKLMAVTGMRRFEVRDLELSDIDFRRRIIHIREGKGGKNETSPARLNSWPISGTWSGAGNVGWSSRAIAALRLICLR